MLPHTHPYAQYEISQGCQSLQLGDTFWELMSHFTFPLRREEDDHQKWVEKREGGGMC